MASFSTGVVVNDLLTGGATEKGLCHAEASRRRVVHHQDLLLRRAAHRLSCLCRKRT